MMRVASPASVALVVALCCCQQLVSAHATPQFSSVDALRSVVDEDGTCVNVTDCGIELLQTDRSARAASNMKVLPGAGGSASRQDLVFMHIPFNFGHTIEFVSMLRPTMLDMIDARSEKGWKAKDFEDGKMPEFGPPSGAAGWVWVAMMKRPGGKVWGHMNPNLQEKNEVTRCPMYYTPPKYWPIDLAKKYFGKNTVFGVLRNPYERLIALFRGNYDGYGGANGDLHKTCDVNEAIKRMLQKYQDGDMFAEDCTFVPQAEYFEGEYGIKLPIDNQLFPQSMNDAFSEHGFNFHIRSKDIQHVDGCNNVWAGDLTQETKALVRKVYKRDFDLLCTHFNYCDPDENVCLNGVPSMCPETLFSWNSTIEIYVAK